MIDQRQRIKQQRQSETPVVSANIRTIAIDTLIAFNDNEWRSFKL